MPFRVNWQKRPICLSWLIIWHHRERKGDVYNTNMAHWHNKNIRWGKRATFPPPIMFTAFLFCLSLRLSVCPCSHPTLLVTLATTYTLHRLRKNHRIVYDQAGMLLIKVTACLMYREHTVFKSVYADETIAHKWNYTAALHWYEPCQEWTEARVGQTLAGHQSNGGKSVLSLVAEVKNWHLEVRLFSVRVIPKSSLRWVI